MSTSADNLAKLIRFADPATLAGFGIVGADAETMELLNPALRRGMTPPGSSTFALRIPVGTQQTLLARMSELTTHSKGFFTVHRVKRGESLGSIARRYRAEVQEIMDLNNIPKVTRLKVGQELSIPQSEGGSSPATVANNKRIKKNTFLKAKDEPTTQLSLDGDKYLVQNGDTLWDISRKHNVSVEELKRVNNIRSKRDFRAGITITIPKKSGSYNKSKARNRAR